MLLDDLWALVLCGLFFLLSRFSFVSGWLRLIKLLQEGLLCADGWLNVRYFIVCWEVIVLGGRFDNIWVDWFFEVYWWEVILFIRWWFLLFVVNVVKLRLGFFECQSWIYGLCSRCLEWCRWITCELRLHFVFVFFKPVAYEAILNRIFNRAFYRFSHIV